MGLCSFCSSIPLNLFSIARDKQCTINHHPSFQALQESGASGCELCRLFLHAIQKQTEDGENDRVYGRWPEDGSVTVRSTKFDEQHVQIGYKQAGKFRGKLVPPGWCDPKSPSIGGEWDKEISIINYWLDNCQSNHADCASSQLDFMPTRVIDVGLAEKQEPRLVPTIDLTMAGRQLNSQERRYLALSHCWGPSMPPSAITTSSTLPERLQAIPLASLTATFADFIGIARRMRVQYVWIDSLCIIQDSNEDWEKEAAQMAFVYSNAYCTIAASSASSGNDGCHVNPELEPYGPVILSFSEADESGNLILQKVHVFSLFGTPIVSVLPQDPLSGRGWTFQERELSSRILHYSKDSIRWECRSLKASLQFPWLDTNAFNGTPRIFDMGQIRPRRPEQQPTDDQKNKDQEVWFRAVENYSDRALTKQSDRLTAFSGIARAVRSRTGDRYLAGLWASNLIHCLCWTSTWSPAGKNPVFHPERPEPIFHSRQTEYLAPSWSWACIRGQVRYEWWIFHALDPDLTPNALRFVPRVLDAQTIPAGEDDFGLLKGGYIRLEGKLKPAFTRGEGFARQGREGVYDVHEGQIREVGMIKYDVPSESPVGQIKVIICLCVLPRAERHGDLIGLALVPTRHKDEYKRVGLVFDIKLEWYERSAEGRITIV